MRNIQPPYPESFEFLVLSFELRPTLPVLLGVRRKNSKSEIRKRILLGGPNSRDRVGGGIRIAFRLELDGRARVQP